MRKEEIDYDRAIPCAADTIFFFFVGSELSKVHDFSRTFDEGHNKGLESTI